MQREVYIIVRYYPACTLAYMYIYINCHNHPFLQLLLKPWPTQPRHAKNNGDISRKPDEMHQCFFENTTVVFVFPHIKMCISPGFYKYLMALYEMGVVILAPISLRDIKQKRIVRAHRAGHVAQETGNESRTGRSIIVTPRSRKEQPRSLITTTPSCKCRCVRHLAVR